MSRRTTATFAVGPFTINAAGGYMHDGLISEARVEIFLDRAERIAVEGGGPIVLERWEVETMWRVLRAAAAVAGS